MPAYKVLIDDNFHYMDESERIEHGVFATAADAIAACQRIVEDSLRDLLEPGMTPTELHVAYTLFGSDPFIVSVDGAERVDFSAWTYAQGRSAAIAEGDRHPPASPSPARNG
jgi:hypothetical protein